MAHGEIVELFLSKSKQPGKVIKGIEGVSGIEFFIVFSMAAFHPSCMSWSKRFDLLVTYVHLSQCFLKNVGGFFLLFPISLLIQN